MNSNIYAKCVARAQRESAGCFSCPYESSFSQLICECNIQVMHTSDTCQMLASSSGVATTGQIQDLGCLTAVYSRPAVGIEVAL
jgi:hypothetical protein